MADERDFELLDDYLSNRMREQDRPAFEQRLQSDPDLLQEYTVQKRVIQGIKDARVTQLKSMLNQIPVPSSSTGNAFASKVFIGAVVAIVIAAAALWFYRNEAAIKEQPSVQSEQKTTTPTEEPANKSAEPQMELEQPSVEDTQPQESDRNQTSAGTEHSKPSLAKRPDPVSGPPASDNSSAASAGGKAAVANVSVNIKQNSDYSFHYQFDNGKLTLYGPFESGAYEIVAIQYNTGKLMSLYYNEKYYMLTEGIKGIRKLDPVTDPALLNKLHEQRASD